MNRIRRMLASRASGFCALVFLFGITLRFYYLLATGRLINVYRSRQMLEILSDPDRRRSVIFGIWMIFYLLMTGVTAAFSPEKADFAVRFGEEVSSYRVTAVFVLPGEEVIFEMLSPSGGGQYVLQASGGSATQKAPGTWRWQAPEQVGLYPARITDPQSGDSIILHVFVMVPYDRLKGEHLNGYRIGRYPSIALKQLAIYEPPRGFIEVTEENAETLLTPHFRLRQFLCKQSGGYPKYLVLKERLMLKLELILEKVNEKGYVCDTLQIMSGYRTPYYNRAIGNVKYSRHVWGGAADIFLDHRPADGMMDDLNRDGSIDYRDASVLYDIVDGMYGQTFYIPFVGGLGRYGKTASHGPFVHVDVRRFRARWGD